MDDYYIINVEDDQCDYNELYQNGDRFYIGHDPMSDALSNFEKTKLDLESKGVCVKSVKNVDSFDDQWSIKVVEPILISLGEDMFQKHTTEYVFHIHDFDDIKIVLRLNQIESD